MPSETDNIVHRIEHIETVLLEIKEDIGIIKGKSQTSEEKHNNRVLLVSAVISSAISAAVTILLVFIR